MSRIGELSRIAEEISREEKHLKIENAALEKEIKDREEITNDLSKKIDGLLFKKSNIEKELKEYYKAYESKLEARERRAKERQGEQDSTQKIINSGVSNIEIQKNDLDKKYKSMQETVKIYESKYAIILECIEKLRR